MDYGKAPVMEFRMKKIHPARAYQSLVNEDLYRAQKEVKVLQTKKQIASFLMNHSADDMHELINVVSSEIASVEVNC